MIKVLSKRKKRCSKLLTLADRIDPKCCKSHNQWIPNPKLIHQKSHLLWQLFHKCTCWSSHCSIRDFLIFHLSKGDIALHKFCCLCFWGWTSRHKDSQQWGYPIAHRHFGRCRWLWRLGMACLWHRPKFQWRPGPRCWLERQWGK